MPGSSDASFIPKRGTNKRSKKAAKNRVYLFTLVSYILLFTTLIATAGVYFYNRYVDQQLQVAIADLNTEISSFKQADMERVQAFDLRLRQAKDRLDNSVSVSSIFEALESATINTVRIADLSIKRNADTEFELDASIETNTFDSSLFQRGVFERNKVVESIEIENIDIQKDIDGLASDSKVFFTAKLTVPVGVIPFVPEAQAASTPPPVSNNLLDTASTSDEVVDDVEVNESAS